MSSEVERAHRGRIFRTSGVLRHSQWDVLSIALSFAHGALLLFSPSAPLIAIALWWSTNTIAHSFVHLPFFRSHTANRIYSLYLSLLLGFPQSLFRDRHLAHHAECAARIRVTAVLVIESLAVGGLWVFLAAQYSSFLRTAYLPGYAAGMALCLLHKYYEHAGGTVSHYRRLYNLSFLNDGYHVEHHAHPAEHWSRLPQLAADGRVSSWPAVLRWLELFSLDSLERLVVRSAILQKFMLRTHARALCKLLPKLGSPSSVTIVGGGIFPRTALLLREMLPDADLTIVDASGESIAIGRRFLDGGMRIVRGMFDGENAADTDLVTIPLSYKGNREAIYQHPPAPSVLIHDWIWSKRGESVVVSWLLLKRLNLVRQTGPSAAG